MSAASMEDLKRWFQEGLEQKATHMIVVCDRFSYDDYPVYVRKGEDPRAKAAKYDGKNMQKIMEVYNLSLSMNDQLEADITFNY